MRGNLREARSGLDAAVAEQNLYDPGIGSLFEQMGGERVAQRMRGDPFGDAGPFGGIATGNRECCLIHMVAFAPGREEVVFGPRGAPVASQDLQQALRQGYITVLAA